eukprot:3909287-Rhodomonas_salina.1
MDYSRKVWGEIHAALECLASNELHSSFGFKSGAASSTVSTEDLAPAQTSIWGASTIVVNPRSRMTLVAKEGGDWGVGVREGWALWGTVLKGFA